MVDVLFLTHLLLVYLCTKSKCVRETREGVMIFLLDPPDDSFLVSMLLFIHRTNKNNLIRYVKWEMNMMLFVLKSAEGEGSFCWN